MKTFYTAYAKTIDGTPFYFVKKYQTFPEYKDVPPILETYGMHKDFGIACKIAQVFDKDIRQKLLREMENNAASSKVLPLYPSAAEIYRLKRKHNPLLSLSKIFKLRFPKLIKQASFTSATAGNA